MTEKKKRGFAAMTPEQRRTIQSAGGRAVPVEKRTFSQDRKLASQAGKTSAARRASKETE